MPAPTSSRSRAASECSDLSSPTWYNGILTDADFNIVYPTRAVFLSQLRDLADRKSAVLADANLSAQEKRVRLDNLCIRAAGGAECALDDLW